MNARIEANDNFKFLNTLRPFKDSYFEYKAKAENTWKLTTNALFVRLDSFLERCHDILHLTNTIV